MTTVAPAAACILAQATALWPNRSRLSDGTIGDTAHASRVSDHNPDSRGIVHAADLTHDPSHGCDAHAWADTIRQRAKAGQEPRLKYVISNRRIASATSSWNWDAYDGTNPHEHHAHFSVHDGGIENDTRAWFVGADEGDDDMTTVAEMRQEFLNADKRATAREDRFLKKLEEQAQRHNEAARERDARLLVLLERLVTKVDA